MAVIRYCLLEIRKRMSEKLLIFIAWHMPRPLVKWCYIRVGAHATTGQFSGTVVPEITMTEALKRWDEPHYGGWVKSSDGQYRFDPEAAV